MDTSLEGKKITWKYIIPYGIVTELVPISLLLIHVYVWGNLLNPDLALSLTHEYMIDYGMFFLLAGGFIAFSGTTLWIAKRSISRTFYNGVRLVIVGSIVEILFFFIVGLEFRMIYVFSILVKFVASILGGVTPRLLKGKQTHKKTIPKQEPLTKE